MKKSKFLPFLALLCSTLLSTTALAQWQWTDAQGRKVFSDLPPPMDVPEKNIVKRPSPRSPDASVKPAGSEKPATEAGENQDSNQPSRTGVAPSGGNAPSNPELDAKTLQAQEAQKAQQRAEESRQAQIRADNCARARQAKANLESGLPLMQINAQGHRVLMDEATKAAELKRAQDTITSDCPR